MSAMSSYQVVKRAIEFGTPDRLPIRFDALGVTDVHRFAWNQIPVWDTTQENLVDEWHCVWERSEQGNMGQVKGHPLLDLDQLDHFDFPDPDNPAYYEGMEKKLIGSEGKYVLTGIFFLFFDRLHSLHGFAETLMDLKLDPARMGKLADRIVEFDLGIIENIARRFPNQIHGFRFTDDWGSQQALLASPQTWNAFFKPRYKRIFDAIHRHGWHVWMHSCGKINLIIEPLIEIGVNVLNLQQPQVLGIEQIGKQFAGRVCFESLCDIQRTLPFKGKPEIEAEAAQLLEHWGTPQGGFILSDYGDGGAIGTSDENKRIMFNAFLAADRWRQRDA